MRRVYCDVCGKSDSDIDVQEWSIISTKQKCTTLKKDVCAMCAERMLEQFKIESENVK